MHTELIEKVITYLAEDIGSRPLGSEANGRALVWAEALMGELRCAVERQVFAAKGWEPGDSGLKLNGVPLPHLVNPYSPAFRVQGPLLKAGTLEELEAIREPGAILLLHEALGAETVMPKSFTFYNPPHHGQLVSRLEALAPALVIAVRDENLPDNVTGVSGKTVLEPVFNDGDLPFPSVTVTLGHLAALGGVAGCLIAEAWSQGVSPVRETGNLVARLGDPEKPRVLVTAHLDTFFNTPGALDDASGIAFLTALAASGLRSGAVCLELVLINGEDHYGILGERALMAALAESAKPTVLAVNVAGLGYRGTKNGVSCYAMPPALEAKVAAAVAADDAMALMDPWPQGDHMIFASLGIPTLALASCPFEDYLARCHHSPADTADQADPALVDSAVAWLVRFLEAF